MYIPDRRRRQRSIWEQGVLLLTGATGATLGTTQPECEVSRAMSALSAPLLPQRGQVSRTHLIPLSDGIQIQHGRLAVYHEDCGVLLSHGAT